MSESAKPSVLAILATLLKLLVQVPWVATKALLMVLRWETLSALAEGVVGSRSRAAGLGAKGRWAWSAALRLTKGLQGVLTRALLAALLLDI
jgi:hypothetical protein